MIEGTVKWYDRKRGYGFITDELGTEVFVHYTSFHSSLTELSDGDAVCFKLMEGEKGPRAFEVMLKAETEEPETV